jgi:hypothetical protein
MRMRIVAPPKIGIDCLAGCIESAGWVFDAAFHACVKASSGMRIS